MKQIPQEIIRRIHSLYCNEPSIAFRKTMDKGDFVIEQVDSGWQCFYPSAWLEVTPLSLITDEDAIEVQKMIGWEFKEGDNITIKIKAVKEALTEASIFQSEFSPPISIIDFLRSKGYALPCMGYTVEELVEAGVFKLKY